MTVLEVWQMTQAQFKKEKRMRKDCRQIFEKQKEEDRQRAIETGFPVGRVYGLIEWYAQRPSLHGVSHKREVLRAVREGKPVPSHVLAEYADGGNQ